MLTVQQVLVHRYFCSFVYSITTKQVESSLTVWSSVLLDSSSSLVKAQQFSLMKMGY